MKAASATEAPETGAAAEVHDEWILVSSWRKKGMARAAALVSPRDNPINNNNNGTPAMKAGSSNTAAATSDADADNNGCNAAATPATTTTNAEDADAVIKTTDADPIIIRDGTPAMKARSSDTAATTTSDADTDSDSFNDAASPETATTNVEDAEATGRSGATNLDAVLGDAAVAIDLANARDADAEAATMEARSNAATTDITTAEVKDPWTLVSPRRKRRTARAAAASITTAP